MGEQFQIISFNCPSKYYRFENWRIDIIHFVTKAVRVFPSTEKKSCISFADHQMSSIILPCPQQRHFPSILRQIAYPIDDVGTDRKY